MTGKLSVLPKAMADRVKKFHAPTGISLVYLSVFIDMFGGLMAVPVMPFMVKQNLGCDPTSNGVCSGASEVLAYASALYQFASVFATPLTARLSDKFGRRPFFILGFLGSAVGFLVIGVSGSNYGLLAGRFIGGLFSASAPLATPPSQHDAAQLPEPRGWRRVAPVRNQARGPPRRASRGCSTPPARRASPA